MLRLLRTLRTSIPLNPEVALLDDAAFFDRLSRLGYDYRLDEDGWLGFWEANAKCLIDTDPLSEVNNKYDTPRKRAWRNMMVSAINVAISKSWFSVLPGTNRWPGYVNGNQQESYVYSFSFGEGIPATASVRDIGYEELSIHVALWPTGKDIRSWTAGFSAGEAFATGWLERGRGAWLQFTPELFHCRRRRIPLIEAVEVRAKGFGDRGRFFM